MSAFVDTSVFVAAYWGEHPEHVASLKLVAELGESGASCSAHTVAEVYSTLTRLPVRRPTPPEQVMLVVADLEARFNLVSLELQDYAEVIRDAAERGIAGGRIYDALLLRCARKVETTALYTWNVKDFRAIAPDFADRIRTP